MVIGRLNTELAVKAKAPHTWGHKVVVTTGVGTRATSHIGIVGCGTIDVEQVTPNKR